MMIMIALFFGQYLVTKFQVVEAIEVLNPISTSTPLALFLIGYSYLMLNEFELAKEIFYKLCFADENSDLKAGSKSISCKN